MEGGGLDGYWVAQVLWSVEVMEWSFVEEVGFGRSRRAKAWMVL